MTDQITLRRLTLKNFKKHEGLEVEFGDGLNAIVGPNYAGKTTILEGIFFALFGARAVAGMKDDLTTHGKSGMAVTLELAAGEGEFTIRRTLSSATVTSGDRTLASSSTQVAEWVTDKLGMPSMQEVLSLAYSRQTETAALLSIGAAGLNLMVEALSGADLADRLISRARAKAKASKAVLDALPALPETRAGDDLPRLEEVASATGAKLLAASKAVVAARDAAQGAEEQLAVVLNANRAAAEHNAEVERELARRAAAEELVERLKSERDPDGAALDLAPLAAARDEAEEHYLAGREAASRVEFLEREVRRSSERMEALASRYEETEAQIEEGKRLSSDLPEAEERAAEAEKSLRAAEERFMHLKAVQDGAACPACHRPFEDKDQVDPAEVDAAREALAAARAAARQARKDLDDLNAAIVRVRPKYDLEELQKEYTELETSVILRQEEAEKAKADAAGLPAADSARDATRKAYAEAEARHKAAVSARDRYEKAAAALDSGPVPEKLPEDHEKAQELQAASKRATEALLSATDREREVKARANEAGRALDVCRAAVAAEEELAAKRAASERDAKVFRDFAGWLQTNKSVFLQSVWDGIMATAGQFSSIVTEGRIEGLSRDPEKGRFLFTEHGNEKPIDGVASGGQKSIAGVGMRLALADLLPSSLGFIALDEPSSELDEEHAASLAGALRAQGRQVILITHRSGEVFESDTLIEL